MASAFSSAWSLITPFWRSKEKGMATLLLIVIIALNLLEVYIHVLLNKWNNDFYNSLQAVDSDAFFKALIRFIYLAGSIIAVIVYKVYMNQMLQIRWRRWLTTDFLSCWLNQHTHYRMRISQQTTDNPDQRISDDIDQFISLTLDLSLGLLNAVVSLFSFLFILWNLSGMLTIPLGDFGTVTIPGYMVWAALVYAVGGTYITSLLGRPLIALNFDKQKYEADFRFSLMRFRENSELIAFYGGEAYEMATFETRFRAVIANFRQIMKRQKMLGWFTSGYYQIAVIFPFVMAAPRFFSKQLQLGGLMQTASAFSQVQGSFSYVINSYTGIALWRAVVRRLTGFKAEIMDVTHAIPKDAAYKTLSPETNDITASGFNIHLPNGHTLLSDLNFTITPGHPALIKAPSGTGKSTLLRALAGLWPYASGTLTLPAKARFLFLPQYPYLPLGTLRDAITYPANEAYPDEVMRDVMIQCGLDHLIGRLDETEAWSYILSPGERQRVAFARVLLIKPDYIFLDEATSALDETSEAYFYQLLRKLLPDAAIISVGHRQTLDQWHTMIIDLSDKKPAV